MRLTRSQKIVVFNFGECGRRATIKATIQLSDMTSVPQVAEELDAFAEMLIEHRSEEWFEALYTRVCAEYPTKYIRDFLDDEDDFNVEDMWDDVE